MAQKYLDGQGCSLLTLGVQGGYEAAIRFYDALKLVTRVVNLGDAKSLACHPASTTHRQMSPDIQRKAGVLPEMIRLSIGIEHVDDILADLDQALNAATCKEITSAICPSTLTRSAGKGANPHDLTPVGVTEISRGLSPRLYADDTPGTQHTMISTPAGVAAT